MRRFRSVAYTVPLRLLVVGPLPPPLGGATVLFNQLVKGLQQSDAIDVTVLDTARRTGTTRTVTLLKTVAALIRQCSRCQIVSLHTSLSGALAYGAAVRVVAFLFRKPVIFRGFGGNYPVWYRSLPRWKQWFFRYSVLKSNAVLLETKESVEFFAPLAHHRVVWYPNSRHLAETSRKNNKKTARNLVFVGQIKTDKGVDLLIDVARDIPDIRVDFFGPFSEEMDEHVFSANNVRYLGVLEPSIVQSKLRQYDALVMPTFYDGEGYPGVILEAFAAGLPVVTTRWRCITEIVDETCGVLVAPKDGIALKQGINQIKTDEELYARCCSGALDRAKFFSAESWTQHFEILCQELVNCRAENCDTND